MERAVSFSINDLIINDNSKKLKYEEQERATKSIHWGQRKLLMSEIEFFTLYLGKDIKDPLCVYVGAASGTHIAILSNMFPSLQFHLYDPNKFAITETNRIKIFNEYFTDKIAKTYAGRNNVFFISDIRTVDSEGNFKKALEEVGITKFDRNDKPEGPYDLIKKAKSKSNEKNEKGIWEDMENQQNWVLIINPIHALLKFRLPWPQEYVDGEPVDRTVSYLKGIVFWQPWAGQNSTETRLKPIKNNKGNYEKADWSIVEYEQWCAFHNRVDRVETVYQNIFTDTIDPILAPELLNDYDSVAEAYLLKMYFNSIGIKDTTKIIQFSQIITFSLAGCGDKSIKSLAELRGIVPTIDPFRKKEAPKKLLLSAPSKIPIKSKTLLVPPKSVLITPKSTAIPRPRATVPKK